MGNWLVDMVNQEPVYQALEMVGGVMLTDHVDFDTAVTKVGTVIKERMPSRFPIFHTIMELHKQGKTVAEITEVLIKENDARS